MGVKISGENNQDGDSDKGNVEADGCTCRNSGMASAFEEVGCGFCIATVIIVVAWMLYSCHNENMKRDQERWLIEHQQASTNSLPEAPK